MEEWNKSELTGRDFKFSGSRSAPTSSFWAFHEYPSDPTLWEERYEDILLALQPLPSTFPLKLDSAWLVGVVWVGGKAVSQDLVWLIRGYIMYLNLSISPHDAYHLMTALKKIFSAWYVAQTLSLNQEEWTAISPNKGMDTQAVC